ncbi:MAG: HlyD family type I secretion periplasmic adaptor subunit [Geminicoccaceae bacterium]
MATPEENEQDVVLDDNPRPFAFKGLLAIAIAFIGFGGWAATAPLDSAAIAPGQIIVDGGRQKIQHLEGGTVLEMLVDDGDRVEQGQVLLRLDATQARASRSIVEASFLTAKGEESRVLSELRGAPEIAFDDVLLKRAERPEVKQIIDVQRELFLTRTAIRRRKIEVLNTQIHQLQNEIAALEAEHQARSRQMALSVDELEGLQTLLLEGLTEKTQVIALERDLESLKGDRLSIEAQIAKARNQISEVDGQIALEQSSAQDALNQELKDAQLRVLQAREGLVGAQDVLQRIDIRSPVSGLVANNSAVTVGGVVAPGELIMEVVPTKELLVIDAKVSILDVDSVKIGQTANVLLTGFNQANTPTLTGRVDHLAADRQVDEVDNQPFYQAKIIVPEDELSRLDNGQELRPGMPADAIIVTGERTMLEYLLKPLTRSLARSWREE